MRCVSLTICLLAYAAGPSAFAAPYVIQKGETLSEIALHSLGGPVYQKGGALERLLTLNPDIKNPDLIYAGRTLAIEPENRAPAQLEMQVETPAPPPAEPHEMIPVQNDPPEPPLNLALEVSFGSSFLSLTQTGAFGGGSATTIPLGDWYFGTRMRYQDWFTGFSSRSRKLSILTESGNTNSTIERSISEQNFRAGWKSLFLGLKYAHSQFVRVADSTLSWAEVTSFWASVGYELNLSSHSTPEQPALYLALARVQLEYPFAASAQTGIDLSSPKGMGFQSRLAAKKRMWTLGSKSLYLGMDLIITYTSLQVTGTWDTSTGTAKSSHIEFRPGLNLEFQF